MIELKEEKSQRFWFEPLERSFDREFDQDEGYERRGERTERKRCIFNPFEEFQKKVFHTGSIRNLWVIFQ